MNFISVSAATSKNTPQTSLSPSSYSTVVYTGSRIMWVYKPPGYDGNSNNYPLIVFFPGYGATDRSGGSFSNVNNSGEGLGQYLLAGDRPPNILMCIPQNLTPNVDYGFSEWDAALTYMGANYRVNTNQQYATGLSGGAIACFSVISNRTNCASIVSVSGPSFSNNWTSLSGFGFWQHHGTSDSTFGLTIGGTLYRTNGASGGPIDLTPAPRTTYYYPLGHVSGVWDTQVYNRLERTDHAGTAAFDYIRFLKKFSKDANEQATNFVTNSEYSLDVVDYRESVMLVNQLSSGSLKDSLTARLSTLQLAVNRNGIRYVVSPNNGATTVSTTGINDWNGTFAASDGLSNIVDESGGASTISFVVTNQFASSSRSGNAGNNNAGRSKYKGFPLEYNLGGLVLNHAISNGSLTISNVPTGKLVDIIIHNSHITGDDDDHAISAQSSISTTINGVTQTQYSEYNNAYYLKFTNIPESSGNVVIDMHPVSTRDIILVGFEILIHD